MASPKVKSKPARKMNAAAPPPAGSGKSKMMLWIGVLVLFVIVAEVKLMNGPKESGVFTVQIASQFSGDDQPCGAFDAYDVVKVGADRLALSDRNRILLFDMKGTYVGGVNQKQAGLPKFNELSNMSADAKGRFYVMDAWNGLIRGFDLSGRPTVKIPVPQAYGPRGVASNGDQFYVADTGTHQIKKLSTDGTLLATIGHQGSDKGAFNNPNAVVVDQQGNIYVSDSDNHRVQELDLQGKFLRKFDVGERVANVAVDSQGRVYASSLEGDYVKVFDKDGKDLGKVTEVGKSDRIHSLKGLTISDEGDLVASSHGKVLILHPVPAVQMPAR